MKIQCILPDFWNTKVIVSGKEYAIGHDGAFDVDDVEHAKTLLGNTGKYESADGAGNAGSRPKPGQRPTPILEEKHTGRELSEAETLAMLPKEPAQLKEPATTTPKDEALPNEASPSQWPDVGMASTKAEMLDVLGKLKKAGANVTFKEADTKTDLLEQIQTAYDAMTD